MGAQRKAFVGALADFVAYANEEYEVGDLCEAFPTRLAKLVEGKGERLGS